MKNQLNNIKSDISFGIILDPKKKVVANCKSDCTDCILCAG